MNVTDTASDMRANDFARDGSLENTALGEVPRIVTQESSDACIQQAGTFGSQGSPSMPRRLNQSTSSSLVCFSAAFDLQMNPVSLPERLRSRRGPYAKGRRGKSCIACAKRKKKV